MPEQIFRITSAGSVDDGKSTILARLLLDTGSIYDDQLAKDFDPSRLADLLDGLESEREQGITIDVAHRFFDSTTRRYQVADSPGHEQYTRNMATACAGSDALMLVVDATAGLKPQTKHHLEIALRLGIRDVVFAINKIDLANHSKKVFAAIETEITNHLATRTPHFGPVSWQAIPLSGLTGANVLKTSTKLSWFQGPTLMQALDSIQKSEDAKQQSKEPTNQPKTPALLPVQYVQRIAGGGRRYLGTLQSGDLTLRDKLWVQGRQVTITDLYSHGQPSKTATANEPVSITIDQELDIEPGDIFGENPLATHDQYEADVIWLTTDPGIRGRRYLLRSGSLTTSASITKISGIDLETNQKTGEASSI